MICKNCNQKKNKVLKKFLNFPIAHDFKVASKNSKNNSIKIIFLQCQNCGLLQISETFKSLILKPKYSFIKQKEPEDHLDKIVEKISNLPNMKRNISIVGLTYKDESLLERFKNKGFKNTKIINLNKILNINEKIHFEFLDSYINPKNIKKYVNKYGTADLVVSRHFMEHNFSIKNYLESIQILLKKSKLRYFFTEIPDSLRSLKNLDYPMIWEQHKLYFTNFTLLKTLEEFNFDKKISDIARYHYEDCLLYVGKLRNHFNDKIETEYEAKKVNKEIKISQNYFKKFILTKKRILNFFKRKHKKNKIIAFYGTGHQGIAFINLFNLEKYISYVFDDNKKFQDLVLPGTKLIIKNPKKFKNKIDYCFLCANFKNESQIIKNNKNLLNKKGKFISISFHNAVGLKKYLN